MSATNRPMNQQFYISANTVTADKLEFITDAGPGPAYMSLERTKVGTGPAVPPPLVGRAVPSVPALGIDGAVVPIVEPKNNIVIVGFVTEPTAKVDIFAVDVDPTNGDEHQRLLTSVTPEAGPPAMGNRGRFRFEVGKVSVLPVTREFLVQTQHGVATKQDQQRNHQIGLSGSDRRAQMGSISGSQLRLPDRRRPSGLSGIRFEFQHVPFFDDWRGTSGYRGCNGDHWPA